MTARIEYRFRCRKKPSFVSFSTPFLSPARLRELILKQEHLPEMSSVAYIIMNAQTGHQYLDENETIYKNTPVIVSRLPIATRRNVQQQEPEQAPIGQSEAPPSADAAAPEDVVRSEKEEKEFFYVQPGIPRSYIFRPTRGKVIIPYSEVSYFQRTDENPTADGRWNLEDLKRWMCPICHRLMYDATLTPCCQIAYCNSCITEALLKDQKCPHCQHNNTSAALLTPATQLREELLEWQKCDPEKLKKSKTSEEKREQMQVESQNDYSHARRGDRRREDMTDRRQPQREQNPPEREQRNDFEQRNRQREFGDRSQEREFRREETHARDDRSRSDRSRDERNDRPRNDRRREEDRPRNDDRRRDYQDNQATSPPPGQAPFGANPQQAQDDDDYERRYHRHYREDDRDRDRLRDRDYERDYDRWDRDREYDRRDRDRNRYADDRDKRWRDDDLSRRDVERRKREESKRRRH